MVVYNTGNYFGVEFFIIILYIINPLVRIIISFTVRPGLFLHCCIFLFYVCDKMGMGVINK